MTATVVAATREAWLQSLVAELRPRYEGELPETVHVSVGFTSKGKRSKRIGECWRGECSADKAPQIFIHPALGDPVEVAETVVHELIHACRPDAKHGAGFRSVALRLGLTGRMTATVAGRELTTELQQLVERLGPYPHPQLVSGTSSAGPKQSTRMRKIECPTCGYTARTSQKWLDVGLPSCPEGDEMVPATEEEK